MSRKAGVRQTRLSGETIAPGSSACLLCSVEQRGGIIAYSWTRRWGYHIQIKKARLMVSNWIKKIDLVNLDRNSLCRGLQDKKYPGRESYGEHFLQILLTFTPGPEESFANPLSLTSEDGFATPVGLRIWGLWHGCVPVKSTHLLLHRFAQLLLIFQPS